VTPDAEDRSAASVDTDRLEALMRMLEQDPNDAFCLYGVAQEHLKRGRFDDAVAWFDRAIAADPDHAYAHYHKARALEEGDRIDEAIATLRTGLEVAQRTGDGKAANELAVALDLLVP